MKNIPLDDEELPPLTDEGDTADGDEVDDGVDSGDDDGDKEW